MALLCGGSYTQAKYDNPGEKAYKHDEAVRLATRKHGNTRCQLWLPVGNRRY